MMRLTPLLIALTVGVLSYLTIDGYFDQTLGRLTLSGKFPPGTELSIVAHNRSGGKRAQTVVLGDQPYTELKRAGSGYMNAPFAHLALEFSVPMSEVGAGRDVLNIYNVQFELPYSDLLVVAQNRLPAFFESEQFFGPGDSFVKADSQTGRAVLNLKSELPGIALFWKLIPAVFLSFLVWLVARSHRLSELPAFKDMSLGREISSDREFNMVNGIRGLAAMLVLFSHTAPGFEAVNVGIALLFVISGFLLSKPFILDADRIHQWPKVESYLVKRVKRILPMYYTFVFIAYVLTSQFDTALRNFLFIEASGHLWPMTQILTFYLCLPLVLLATSALWRVHRLLPIMLTLALAILWHQTMVDWKPFYNGRFFKEFYLYAFLLGVAGSYIQFDLLKHWVARSRFDQGLALVTTLLVVATIAWSAPVQPPAWAHPLISPFLGKCVMSIIIIILALNIRAAWFNRVFANPLLQSVGVVGFSFYLLHGLGMQLAAEFQVQILGMDNLPDRSWPFMMMSFVATYMMALFTYSYIERPFFGYRRS